MSTIHDHRVEPKPGSEADPFRYGWRYVTVKQADGRVEREPIPLTLRDLLFPQEGDFAVQYWSHIEDCHHLLQIFKTRLADDPMAKVLCDCRVRFDVPGLEPLGPDVAVFLNSPKEEDVGTLEVAEIGARPALVVEVTSPDTSKNDFCVKKDYYHQAGVPWYLIVDARPNPPKGRRVKLHGFRRQPEGYEPIPLDDRERLWIEPMGVWMAIENARIVCFDGETGERIGDFVEQIREKNEWRARAEAEARAKDEWRARADEWRVVAETELRARLEAETLADTEARLRILVEQRATKAEALVETQARLLDVSEEISEIRKTKLDEAEAELRRLRGEA